MKKFIILLTTFLACFSAFAQLAKFTDGYYRVSSFADRYICVRDNKGGVVVQTTSADMDAIELVKGLNSVVSDPASIIYFEKHGNSYDFQSQGTGVYSIIQYYVNVIVSQNNKSKYWCYASAKGVGAMYLIDANSDTDMTSSWLGTATANDNKEYRDWTVTPISNDSENYFGISPKITYNGKYYQPFFADFPFSFASSGMKAYYITQIDERRGLVVYREITGVIPRQTPVIIECSSANPANNKLTLGGSANSVNGNVSKGVMFNYHLQKHENFVTYNPSTMRLLGLHTDGSLGVVTANDKYVPANTFYLPVSASAPASLKLVTQDEYAQLIAEPVKAEKVVLDKTTLSLLPGETAKLTATVLPDNTTDKTVTWSTDNSKIATVDANGNVTAIAPGSANITAKCGTVSATCKVTVNPIVATSVTLNKTSLDIFVGERPLLTATVAPDNTTDKTVTWSSSNNNVATVDETGRVTGVAIGSAVITAKCGNASATCSVNVKAVPATAVTLDVTDLELNMGDSYMLTATVLPDNTTEKTVTWSTSDPTIASVNKYGRVEAIRAGTCTITATCGSVSATCKVTVKQIMATSVTLNHTELTMNVGDTQSLVATVEPADTYDKFISWTSSDPTVATISSLGTVRAVGPGTTTITAKCNNVSATCVVTVNPIMPTSVTIMPEELELLVGEMEYLSVTILPEDVTDRSIVWASTDEAVATVNDFGIVTANAVGTAVITATCGNMSGSCTVTVKPGEPIKVVLNIYKANMELGDELQLTAFVTPLSITDATIEWSSSAPEVATVDQNGLVKAVGAGDADIIAAYEDVTAICEISVIFDSIMDIVADGSDFDIYTVGGVLVRKDATNLNGLPTGIYVINGHKILINTK